MTSVLLFVSGCGASPGVSEEEATPTGQETRSESVDPEVESAEGFGCSALVNLLVATPEMANPRYLTNDLPDEAVSDFENSLTALTALLSTFSEETDGSNVLVSLKEVATAGWAFQTWALDLEEALNSRDWGADTQDSELLRAPGEAWMVKAYDAHESCVGLGHISPLAGVSESKGALEDFLPYGYWAYDKMVTDLGDTLSFWQAASTTSVPGAKAQLTLLLWCPDNYTDLNIAPSKLREGIRDEDLRSRNGKGFAPIPLATNELESGWGVAVYANGLNYGLFREDQYEAYSSGSDAETTRIAVETLKYLAGFDTVGLGMELPVGEVTGKIRMSGFEKVQVELERLGCWE